jgi:hypothetical protein
MDTLLYPVASLNGMYVPVPATKDPAVVLNEARGHYDSRSRLVYDYYTSCDERISNVAAVLKTAQSKRDESAVKKAQDELYLRVCLNFLRTKCRDTEGKEDLIELITKVLNELAKRN